MIFGCIANEGYINRPNEVEEYCIFNRNQNACNYGVFMGSMAFLCCMAFLALDVYFPQISSVKDRKRAVLADIGVSGNYNICITALTLCTVRRLTHICQGPLEFSHFMELVFNIQSLCSLFIKTVGFLVTQQTTSSLLSDDRTHDETVPAEHEIEIQ